MFEDNKGASGSPRTLVCAWGDRRGPEGGALVLRCSWGGAGPAGPERHASGGWASWASPEELSTWLLLPPFGAFEKDPRPGVEPSWAHSGGMTPSGPRDYVLCTLKVNDFFRRGSFEIKFLK